MRATFAETFAGCFAELAEASKRRDEMIAPYRNATIMIK